MEVFSMKKMVVCLILAVVCLTAPAFVRADVITPTILNGANERPNPVNTPATGLAIVTLDEARTMFTINVTFSGLTGPLSMGHIHVGGPEVAGPVILPFDPFLPVGITSGSFTGVMTAANLRPAAAQGINNFADAINAFLAGNTYVNLHSNTFPGGEIRGQLAAAPEPGSLALALLGGAGLAVMGFVRRRTK
jgi:hypothetical protein